MKGTRASEGDRNKWEKSALLLRGCREDPVAASGAALNSVVKEYEKALSGKRAELLI